MLGNFKIRKNDQKNKKVINAERLFNQIAGQEFQRRVVPPNEINTSIESEGKADPKGALDESLFNADFVSVFMKEKKIKEEKKNNGGIKR